VKNSLAAAALAAARVSSGFWLVMLSRVAVMLGLELATAGGPDRTRTCDLRFRKPLLYPAELRDQVVKKRRLYAGTPTRKATVATELTTEVNSCRRHAL
jgi:hypothetical protein